MPVQARHNVPNARPSFLESVLTNAGTVEMSNLKEQIAEVTEKISQLKLRVHDYMKSKYVDFDPLLKKNKSFLDKANRTSEEIKHLFDRIESQTKRDLSNSTGELRNLHSSLKESSAVLSITTEFLQMDGAMKNVQDACNEGRFLDASKSIQSLQGLVKNASKDTQSLNMYNSIVNEIKGLFDKFCDDCTAKMNDNISWESTDIAHNSVRQTVKVNSSNSREVKELAQALHLLDELDPWIEKLRLFLKRSILLPLLSSKASINIKDRESYSSMEVVVQMHPDKPPYFEVLENLTCCFEYLHGELDIQLVNGDSFLSLLGSEASEEFCHDLIKICLKKTVPSSSTELKNISDIQERTAAFNNYMVAIGFISEENHSLLDYVSNFDALCANKACEHYLQKAREIMKEDLQDMDEVGPKAPAIPLSMTFDGTLSEAVMERSELFQDSYAGTHLKPETELNANLFQFPRCCISKSTQKILDLVIHVLEEASRNTKQSGLPQVYWSTSKSIIELYMAVVPHIHEKLLNSIPQQVALFHNNCMYLAHHLIVLGFKFETSLQAVMKTEMVVTFVDLVQCLRNLGTSIFLKHMQRQRKQVTDTVKESGLATLGESSKLSPDTERSLRQCLRQLELLQTVWQNVLPLDIYCKSIGVLANAFIEELIVRVTSVEDIPANTAVQLTSLFNMVQERIPLLFESGKITLYVKRWNKFIELINILGASLRDIEERWADGKGPLAHEFTGEQVKQLIRALFQNTQRRADVLVKIR